MEKSASTEKERRKKEEKGRKRKRRNRERERATFLPNAHHMTFRLLKKARETLT